MKRLKNHFILTLAFTGIAVVGTLVNAGRAFAQGGPRVQIEGPLPLPVQVTIQPLQAELCVQAGGGGNFCGGKPSSVAVPANRLLVIEYASGRCPRAGTSLGTGQDWAAALQTTAGGTMAKHLLHPAAGVSIGNPQLVSAMGLNGFDVTQQMRIYADPGSQVVLGFEDLGGLGDRTITCEITISGHMSAQ